VLQLACVGRNLVSFGRSGSKYIEAGHGPLGINSNLAEKAEYPVSLSADQTLVAGGSCESGVSVPSIAYPLMAQTTAPSGLVGLAPLACIFAFATLLAGCAQQPQQGAEGVWRNPNTNEFFPASRYGTASPRVVENGRPVPRGGGRALVGKPYTIAGKRYVPREVQPGYTQTGRASWYGDAFHGRKTANGEIYDMTAISAAHPTMPLPSYARVTNLGNGRSIIVRVNDRGPYHGGRVIDLSKRVADALDFRRFGTANVKVDYIRPAGVAGSDDRQLVASLRTDGSPAQFDGGSGIGTTMIAAILPQRAEPAPSPAPVPSPPPQQQSSILAMAPPQRPPEQRSIPNLQAQPVVFEPEEGMTAIGRSTRGLPGGVPLPPVRPLDLATIPGASVPIAPPPRRTGFAPASTGTATFFAPLPRREWKARVGGNGPFGTLDTTGLMPLRD
jgi:rare lipoprotein A